MTAIIYYVYILFRDDAHLIPFYVGKGKGRRMYEHEGAARSGERSHKANIIRQIHGESREVPKERIDCDSEAEAFALEIELIALFGRKVNGTGILANLTNGGEGVSGMIWSDEALEAKSATATLRWAKPGAHEAMSAAIVRHCAQLGIREAMSAAQTRRMAQPGVREATSAALVRHCAQPGAREAVSVALVRCWAQPGFREAMSAASTQRWAQPGAREAMGTTLSVTKRAIRAYPVTQESDGYWTSDVFTFPTRKQAVAISKWLYQIDTWKPTPIAIEPRAQFEFREAAE
jgi:hypothetical protein